MAGRIKEMIERIIQERSKGNPTIASTTEAKIILKGINPTQYSANSEDDPKVLEKLKLIASEFGIKI
jgi:hypothetical protein